MQRKLQKQLLFTIKDDNGLAEKYYSTLKTTADGTKVLSISCGSDSVKDTGPQDRKRMNKPESIKITDMDQEESKGELNES